MKNALVVFAIVLLALSAGAAESKHMPVYIGAGFSVPTGDAGDGWNVGFHGQVGFGIAAGPRIEIIPTVGYHTFALDKQGTTVSGGGLSVLMFGGDCKISFVDARQKTAPYILGGLGVGNAKISDVTIPGYGTLSGDSETKVYFNFGAGVDIGTASSTAFFVQGRFVSVSTSGSAITYIPLTVGLRF
jgi:hypothetical protein